MKGMFLIIIILIVNVTALDCPNNKVIDTIEKLGYNCVNIVIDRYTTDNLINLMKTLTKNNFYLKMITIQKLFNYSQSTGGCILYPLNFIAQTSILNQVPFGELKGHSWLIVNNEEKSANTVFEKIDVRFDGDVFYDHCFNNKIEKIYRVRSDYPLQVVPFNTHIDRYNLEGIPLRPGVNNEMPSAFYNAKNHAEGKPCLTGYSIDLFNVLESSLNFTMNFTGVHGAVGALKNNKWSGLVEKLLNNDIDVILASFNMNPQRLKVADCPMTIMITRYQVFMKAGQIHAASLASLLSPLDQYVWLTLLGCIIIITITGTICIKCRNQYEIRDPAIEDFGLPTRIFCTFQSLCQQSNHWIPDTFSYRLVTLMVYLTATVLIPSYSASLVSSLTQRSPIKPFKTLEEMKQVGFKLLLIEDTADFNFFSLKEHLDIRDQNWSYMLNVVSLYLKQFLTLQTSENEVVMDIFKTSVTMVYKLFGYGNKLKEICDSGEEKMAMFSEEKATDYAINSFGKSECIFLKLDQPVGIIHQTIALPKDSPYTNAFKLRLIRFREVGIIDKVKYNYWPRKIRYVETYQPVTVNDVVPIIHIFGYGVIASLLILLVERLITLLY